MKYAKIIFLVIAFMANVAGLTSVALSALIGLLLGAALYDD